jgi:hypothetical protein
MDAPDDPATYPRRRLNRTPAAKRWGFLCGYDCDNMQRRRLMPLLSPTRLRHYVQ